MSMMQARGASLLEVMIAMLVLGIGILGMATLQLQGLRSSQAALNSSQATQYVNLATDLLRANRGAALNGAYNMALGASPNGTSLAAQDLIYWKRVVASLPGGDGSILVNNQGRATITIEWQGRALAGEGQSQQLIIRTDL